MRHQRPPITPLSLQCLTSPAQIQASARLFRRSLTGALSTAWPPLLFGVRLWASVCLALYIAFWLELPNAYWAGTSAAIVCQPHLCAVCAGIVLAGTAFGQA